MPRRKPAERGVGMSVNDPVALNHQERRSLAPTSARDEERDGTLNSISFICQHSQHLQYTPRASPARARTHTDRRNKNANITHRKQCINSRGKQMLSSFPSRLITTYRLSVYCFRKVSFVLTVLTALAGGVESPPRAAKA